MACEDYPCCGHGTTEHGSPDCPRIDSKGRQRWSCVGCGKELPLKAPSSICTKCQKRMTRRGWDNDLDHDHSMDY